MSDFIFAINAILPIVILITTGYILKLLKLLNTTTLNSLNKVIFSLFLPVSLFVSIYDSSSISDINISLFIFILITTLAIFLLGIVYVMLTVKKADQKGVILQGIFKTNYAIIGIPLASAIAGEAGLRVASMVALITIPICNILATVSLIIFVKEERKQNRIISVLKKIVTNPLIIGVSLGIFFLLIRSVFAHFDISFRLKQLVFIYNPLKSIGQIASPLALVTLGGLFEFSYFNNLKTQVIKGVIAKVVIVPLLALFFAIIFFDFTSAEYAVLISVYATPAAVSSAVIAKEMNNDYILANQLVVWTTLLSGISIFLIILIFRLMSIF